MFRKILIVGLWMTITATSAQSQTPPLIFDQTVFVTCRDAQALKPDARRALAVFLAEYSARRHGVTIPENELGAEVAYLVRGGCTLAPDAYLFTVIDRAITAELTQLPKRQ
jgi:hypothetical protein